MRTPSQALIAKVYGWGLLSNQGMRPEYSGGGQVSGIKPPTASPTGETIDVEKKLAVALMLADPECLSGIVTQELLLNRNTVINKVRAQRGGWGLGCCPSGPLHSKWKGTDLIIPS